MVPPSFLLPAQTHLFIRFAAPKSEEQEVAMGVGAGKVLPVRGKLAIKHRAVSLTFNLTNHSTGTGYITLHRENTHPMSKRERERIVREGDW